MRLIRLKIRNIASLKGEHEIDFQEIQKVSSLFAITGETGSGKSSVLNSIGLALYGQIYKKNVNQLDVVTLGEKEGSIELIFQVKGKYYLADWRAKVRKQNGEPYSTPQTPVRNLYTLESPDLTSVKNISAVTTTELLNLDFDQFCKCIILNQGEFAKFLTSNFTDRKEILEKLYPGELLESMGRELKLELEALEKNKNELEIKLGELKGDHFSGDLLNKEKEQLEKELHSLENVSKNLESLERHFISLFSYFDKYTDNERKKEAIKKDLALHTTKYNEILTKGESVFLRYQKAKKDQETRLPVLQTYLKKEENQKLLEEARLKLIKKSEILNQDLLTLGEKLKLKEQEEKDWGEKLSHATSVLRLPIEDLKNARGHFDSLFDLFSEKELIQKELKGKAESLGHFESSGMELKTQVEDLENELKSIPGNIKELEKTIEEKKNEVKLKSDEKQRAEIKFQEIQGQVETHRSNLKILEEKVGALKVLIEKTRLEILPLETTLKLQEVLNAKELCVAHALSSNTETCPVCESTVPETKWQTLKLKLNETDLKSIRFKFDEGTRLLYQSSQDEDHLKKLITQDKEKLLEKEKELSKQEALRGVILPSLTELDQELDVIKKQAWKQEGLTKELEGKKAERQKIREQYAKLKSEINSLTKLLSDKEEKLSLIEGVLKKLVPVINPDTIRDLKLEVKNLNACLQFEATLTRVLQEKGFLLDQKKKAQEDLSHSKEEEEELSQDLAKLKEELSHALKGEKASDLIQKITQAEKTATEEWNKQVEDQRKQELVLKDSQGRLYTLDELTKDFDLHFTKELHAVKEVAAQNPKPLLSKLKDLSFDFKTSRELFIPIQDMILSEKESYKNLTNECRMKFATVSTRLSDWEKLQDKIQLLELKAKDINEAWARKMRLFEVLGKDELRTFVLSLVEESLIYQTNEELQKLCQGRYEIVHQTRSLRMTPEFYILDKFREGGKRKVSTLSGGETFMVSLAMALGLAEMTRGKAEIDSLFIDEGFGTLDQESLEDVLDMLQQIQTRGLMVGIISHIKTLTHALPVNLVLNKKSDGTSNISLQYN